MRKFLLFVFLALLPVRGWAQAVVPRTLIALYDSREESSPSTTLIHRYLEMPANYLGYDVRYYDVNAPLPPVGAEVRGVLIWFNSGAEVPDADRYLDWLKKAMDGGAHLVVMENFGLGDRWRAKPAIMRKAAGILSRIGVEDTNRWQSLTYQVKIDALDPMLTGFERGYATSLAPYMDTRAVGEGVAHLRVALKEGRDMHESDLIITSPEGGYAASGYALYRVVENNETKLSQWYIDPFLFLREALGEENSPRPDVTTLDGRRIFFAEIDGDGFNELSGIPVYQKIKATNAEVVRKEILEANSDLPFTVGLVGAELAPKCYGLKQSANEARRILALPNVEAASHTYSHPLYWRFFADYSAAKEAPYRLLYPLPPRAESSLIYVLIDLWQRHFAPWKGAAVRYNVPPPGRYDLPERAVLKKYYRTPRSYACAPFSLDREISGNVRLLQRLLPPGKQVKLLDWTGDTQPFAAAIEAADKAGLWNLGGGNAHINSAYPSYSSVPPIGLRLGSAVQLYAANGNEEDMLGDMDGEQAAGFGLFRLSVRMENMPYRLRPLSLYAHMQAGRDAADLHMLKDALALAHDQEIIPVSASDYAAVAAGFYTVRLEPLGDRRWRVENRGTLNTLRFDHAALLAVDFARSEGVLGMRWSHGNLYVALDPAAEVPVVALKPLEALGEYPAAAKPYLIESNWQIKRLQVANNSLIFTAQGYGPLRMQWSVTAPGFYRVTVTKSNGTLVDQSFEAPKNLLNIYMENVTAVSPVAVSIKAEANDKSIDRGSGAGGSGVGSKPVADPAHAGTGADQL